MFTQPCRMLNLAALTAAGFLAALGTAQAELVMKTEHWGTGGGDFAACDQRIKAGAPLNLLNGKGVKVVSNGGLDANGVRFLADGQAGKARADGRAQVDGQPSVITFYLGAPKVIHEVGMFSYNGDSRSNQDFEVRFANNEKSPGKRPEFQATAHVSTGPNILGKGRGGYHTSFLDRMGGPLIPFKADWVEFRIWRTYGVRAGSAGKTNEPKGWTAVVELEVLGDDGGSDLDDLEARLNGDGAGAAIWDCQPTG